MLTSDYLRVNTAGNLEFDGADVVSLASRYSTPLYCMSENQIRSSCREFTKAMSDNYANSMVIYASKALNCKELCRIVDSEGLGIDVVSGGELYTALSVDFPRERIFFHGNNKTASELNYALESGVGTIIVDNETELELLNSIAAAHGVVADIMLRIKPGVEAHTHQYVVTGSIDSKFGFALENGEAFEAVANTKRFENVRLTGIHCHIGSQIFETEPFCESARIMLGFIKKVRDELDVTITKLNLGGGFGIKYVDKNDPLSASEFIKDVASVVKSEAAKLGLELPQMLIEPGRAIVAPAGITLYTVGGVKEIAGVRTYVSVDGGMPDNPRYALYGSEYTAVVANKASKPADKVVTIAGRCCESGDLIQENTYIQQAAPGDIIAVLATGAYNYSMASNYNRIPRPEMVMIKDGEARTIIRRESYEDIVKNDI